MSFSSRETTIRRFVALPTALSLCAIFAGCTPDVSLDKTVRFEPNYVYTEVVKQQSSAEAMDPLADAVRMQINQWFGTPDDPKLPAIPDAEEGLKKLISIENLKMAAGPAPLTATPGDTGLFRQQCATCHGETGQGRGVVAASQNPYPRDFRKGIYKYKTTPRGIKPTKADLKRTLVEGLDGTQMPRFDKLSPKQIDAVVDYIIYLSIRGETERKLLMLATTYDGEPFLDEEKAKSPPAKKAASEGEESKEDSDAYTQESYDEQLEEATTELQDVIDSWTKAVEDVVEFTAPEQTVVPKLAGSTDEVNAGGLAESIARGKKVFSSQAAACAKCHGETGNGLGEQIPDFDDWTKEWTTNIQVNPRDRDALLPFLVKGAMMPQPLMPRNLVEGRLRGGRTPEAVFHRIRYGIDGSPMPAATLKQSPEGQGLSNDDIWDLVNYVLSLQKQPTTPAPAQQVPAA